MGKSPTSRMQSRCNILRFFLVVTRQRSGSDKLQLVVFSSFRLTYLFRNDPRKLACDVDGGEFDRRRVALGM